MPKAFVVGHDWGAVIGWNLCLFRPDRVKGLINLSVPYLGRNLNAESMIKTFGEGFYISQFQVSFICLFSLRLLLY